MLSSCRPRAVTSILRTVLFATVCGLIFLGGRFWSLKGASRSVESILRPGEVTVEIPQKLWYKLGPNGLSDELQGYVDTCLTSNPSYQHEFLTDETGDEFARKNFASRPDVLEAFLALRIPIVKADLLRYLILYAEGGIWNDLDVSCEDVPISEWIPAPYRGRVDLVVGLEFDADKWIRQLVSWTIMAKPRSPHILMIIDEFMEGLTEKTGEHNVAVADLTMDMVGDVVDFSGPRRLTTALLKSLNITMDGAVDERDISNVVEPRLVGDVLVLPDHSFANTMNELHGDNLEGPVLVTHHYAGSWKNALGGETSDDETNSMG